MAAISAFTRVFGALWRPSKGDGPGGASFEARFRSHLRMTDYSLSFSSMCWAATDCRLAAAPTHSAAGPWC